MGESHTVPSQPEDKLLRFLGSLIVVAGWLVTIIGLTGLVVTNPDVLLVTLFIAVGGGLWFAGRRLHGHLDRASAERDAFWPEAVITPQLPRLPVE